jgi:gliding motility-associated-like protein
MAMLPILYAGGSYERLLLAEEICDNALDDDFDGLIDLNDPDCDCPIIEPESLIPNPSFEEMNCCPLSRSQLSCATDWIQASEATTDYLHTCGWMGWPNLPPPLPFPDGEGAVGFRDGRIIQGIAEPNWKEYAGACLLSPLKKNTSYRFEFHIGFIDRQVSPPTEITFFGTTDCDNLPFGTGDYAFGCPTNGPGWMHLGSVNTSGVGWVKSQIDVTPMEDINAIAIGPACPGVPATRGLYYFFDNLVLADKKAFEFVISHESHPCSSDLLLKVPDDPDFTYQWYKDGIAILGAKMSELLHYRDDGDFQVMIIGENECKITKPYAYRVPVIRNDVKIEICEGETYNLADIEYSSPGIYMDTLKSIYGCDSIVKLDLHVVPKKSDSLYVSIFKGEYFDIEDRSIGESGKHVIPLRSEGGCDSIVLLDLSYYQLYIPNTFSPNGDGVNDYFTVFGDSDFLELEELKIFDRWGKRVFEGYSSEGSEKLSWNGNASGTPVANGVYTYTVTVKMDDGRSRQFQGSISVIR